MSECTEGKIWMLVGQIIGGIILLSCQWLYYKWKDNK